MQIYYQFHVNNKVQQNQQNFHLTKDHPTNPLLLSQKLF